LTHKSSGHSYQTVDSRSPVCALLKFAEKTFEQERRKKFRFMKPFDLVTLLSPKSFLWAMLVGLH
jgi:hypothetical protein